MYGIAPNQKPNSGRHRIEVLGVPSHVLNQVIRGSFIGWFMSPQAQSAIGDY
jgi:hypothetical protein